IYVALTSGFELVWIYNFNVADSWWQWALTIVFVLLDLHFLTKACESLPTGTVYAIFAAAGTVGTALMDVFLFEESLTLTKVGFMGLILIGVIGLKVADDLPEKKQRKSKKVKQQEV